MKAGSSRASKLAQTWNNSTTTPKSYQSKNTMNLWTLLQQTKTSGPKDVEGVVELCKVGGSFWSSSWHDFHGTLSYALHFFTSQEWPLEQCVWNLVAATVWAISMRIIISVMGEIFLWQTCDVTPCVRELWRGIMSNPIIIFSSEATLIMNTQKYMNHEIT